MQSFQLKASVESVTYRNVQVRRETSSNTQWRSLASSSVDPLLPSSGVLGSCELSSSLSHLLSVTSFYF